MAAASAAIAVIHCIISDVFSGVIGWAFVTGVLTWCFCVPPVYTAPVAKSTHRPVYDPNSVYNDDDVIIVDAEIIE